MNNRHQNKNHIKQKKLLSAFYDYVGEYHLDNICADIDSRKIEIDNIDIPQSLDDWFDRYINNVKKKEKQRKFIKKAKSISSKTAAILLVLFVSITTLTLSVEAFRTQVYNLLSTEHNEYSRVRIRHESTENVTIEWENYYFPTYMPEGFYVASIREVEEIKEINFINENNEYIVFSQAPNGTDFNLDTEDGIKTELVINNRKAVLTEKEERNILFWNNEEFSFYLVSRLEAEKLQIIAESLEKK